MIDTKKKEVDRVFGQGFISGISCFVLIIALIGVVFKIFLAIYTFRSVDMLERGKFEFTKNDITAGYVVMWSAEKERPVITSATLAGKYTVTFDSESKEWDIYSPDGLKLSFWITGGSSSLKIGYYTYDGTLKKLE